jgi:hypothetical protein
MRDVPSTAVCCSESTERFPDMAFRFVSKAFVTLLLLLLLLLFYNHPFLSPFFRRLSHSKWRQPVRSVGQHMRNHSQKQIYSLKRSVK